MNVIAIAAALLQLWTPVSVLPPEHEALLVFRDGYGTWVGHWEFRRVSGLGLSSCAFQVAPRERGIRKICWFEVVPEQDYTTRVTVEPTHWMRINLAHRAPHKGE